MAQTNPAEATPAPAEIEEIDHPTAGRGRCSLLSRVWIFLFLLVIVGYFSIIDARGTPSSRRQLQDASPSTPPR